MANPNKLPRFPRHDEDEHSSGKERRPNRGDLRDAKRNGASIIPEQLPASRVSYAALADQLQNVGLAKEEKTQEQPPLDEVVLESEAQSQKPAVKTAPQEKLPEADALAEIYGDKTPPAAVVEMLGKLKSEEKRRSYLEKVRNDVFSKADFDELKGHLLVELPGYLKKKESLPPEEEKAADVDVSDAQAPQYIKERHRLSAQAEMDALSETPAPMPEQPLSDIVRQQRLVDTYMPLRGVTAEVGGRGIEVSLPETSAKPEEEVRVMLSQEDLEDHNRLAEYTPKEWHDRLKNLIEGAKGKLNASERVKNVKEYMTSRSGELDAEATKMGRVEKLFRSFGEKYNTLGWKSKLAVGLSLGVGSGVALATSSFALIPALLSGVALQRTAGMASMFLKYEKGRQDEKWGKEKAMGKAIAYTAGMTGLMVALSEGVKEGIEHANQHQWGEATKEWLQRFYPLHPSNSTGAAAHINSVLPKTPLIHTMPHTVSVSEMPNVEATSGHGYEYMMKRLWEQLQEKHITLPENADPNSDIYKLLHADAGSIDKVVHQIASDPKHGFFNPDGTSVSIDAHAHMTVDTDGQIHLVGSHGTGAVHASEGAPITETYSHPEMSESPLPETVIAPEVPLQQIDLSDSSQPLPEPSSGAVPTIEHSFIANQFGVTVPLGEPHIYGELDGKHLFVYGGSPEERTQVMLNYLTRHPDRIIFDSDADGAHRIPWHFSNGEIVSGERAQTNGFFGFFKSFMKAPSPNEFQKLIQ